MEYLVLKATHSSNPTQKLIQYDENFDDDSKIPFVIHPQSDPARGQVQLCHNLIANLFEKGNSTCNEEITVEKIRRQELDHYGSGITNITSFYGIFTIELLPPRSSN